MFDHLRSPFTLRGVTFRNRIFSSGHQTLLAKSGLVTDAFIAYHEARARGGASLIISEAISVHESAYFNQSVPSGYLDVVLPGYRKLADAVHAHDCRLIGQLFHPGAEVAAFLEDGSRPVAWAPSAHEVERYLVTARPMSVALIEDVIEGYGDTAARMIEGGFDGVEVMAHHGCLPIHFLNPRVNHRDDKYGGSLDNRLRFLNAVHDNVRQKVGDEKVVGVRISTDEKTHTGLVEDEVIDVITALDRADRFDFFNIALGSSTTTQGAAHIVPPMVFERGYIAPYTERVKQATNRAVFAVGRMNRPQDAEQALAAGHADMIGMTRPDLRSGTRQQDRARSERRDPRVHRLQPGVYRSLRAGRADLLHPVSGSGPRIGIRTPHSRRPAA